MKMRLGKLDESGRRKPVPIKGSEIIFRADTVIVAIGQTPELSFLRSIRDIKISKQNSILVNSASGVTGSPNIFAAGDVVSGPSTVVEAIAAGRKVVPYIVKHLFSKI